MKNEFDYGYEYAEAMQGEDGFDGPVNINEMLTSTVDIPPGDYTAMRQAGIENPDASGYWQGFNSFFAGRLKCLRCNHQWRPRTPKHPSVCPKCKSPYWDRPRR